MGGIQIRKSDRAWICPKGRYATCTLPELVEVLADKGLIERRVSGLGKEIATLYKREGIQRVTTVCVLKGAFYFARDLGESLQREGLRYDLDFLRARSYKGQAQGDGINIELDVNSALVAGKDVLIVEDMVDTGHTLQAIQEHLRAKGPRSLKTAVLVEKDLTDPARVAEKVEVPVDFVGFVMPDEWLVGYGMDYNEDYRDYPVIGFVPKE